MDDSGLLGREDEFQLACLARAECADLEFERRSAGVADAFGNVFQEHDTGGIPAARIVNLDRDNVLVADHDLSPGRHAKFQERPRTSSANGRPGSEVDGRDASDVAFVGRHELYLDGLFLARTECSNIPNKLAIRGLVRLR